MYFTNKPLYTIFSKIISSSIFGQTNSREPLACWYGLFAIGLSSIKRGKSPLDWRMVTLILHMCVSQSQNDTCCYASQVWQMTKILWVRNCLFDVSFVVKYVIYNKEKKWKKNKKEIRIYHKWQTFYYKYYPTSHGAVPSQNASPSRQMNAKFYQKYLNIVLKLLKYESINPKLMIKPYDPTFFFFLVQVEGILNSHGETKQ